MEDILSSVTLFKKALHLEDYAFRMERWKEKRLGPLRIDAELHRRCNLNCIMCARRASPIDLTEESKNIEMSTQRWIEIVKESAKLGTKMWNISGLGEPMCRPKMLFSVMKMIKAHDMFGEVTTNGTLWSEKDVARTVEMGWDNICVSIDAPDAKTYNSIRRVKRSFNKATKTVKLFRKWREKMSQEVPCITLNVVLNKLNYKKLPSMIELTHELGADSIFVEPMIVYTKLGERIKLGKEEINELKSIIKKSQKLAEEYNIASTITCITPEKNFQGELVEKTSDIRESLIKDAKKYSNEILSIPCYYPWFFLMIRTDGSTIHCGECKDISENIKNKSLEDVWFGVTFENIRKEFMNKGLPDYCKMCRPNVIEDMREIRRSITKYSNRNYMQTKILGLLKENMELKRRVFELRMEKGFSKNKLDKFKRALNQEKELIRFKNSLSYKIGKRVGKTKIGKWVKRKFGVYV